MAISIDLLRSLENVSSLDQLRMNAANELEVRSPLNKLGHDIANFFRSLSASGRAEIASRNEAIAAALKAAVRTASNASQPQEVRDIATRLRAVNVTLQNAAVQSKQRVFNDMTASIYSDARYKAMTPAAQQAFSSSLARVAGDSRLADMPARLDKVRDLFFGTPPAGFDLENGLRRFEESHKTQFRNDKQYTELLPDDIHMAFLKDAKRGCMSNIGTTATTNYMPDEAYTQPLKELLGEEHARFLPFVSMMCSQAGMDCAMIFLPTLCNLGGENYSELIDLGLMPSNDSEHQVSITRNGDTLSITSTFSQPFHTIADPTHLISCKGQVVMTIDLASPEVEEKTLHNISTKSFTRDSGEIVPDRVIQEKTVYMPKFTIERGDVHFEAATA